MPDTSLELEYSRWSIPDQSVRIEYASIILTEIEREVLEGFHRLRKGGVEVGGVLFGSRAGQAITIVTFRPLTCEHALGPGFVLSDRDRQALGGLLGSSSTDPTLTGLVPVGWYRSNTRSHIHLSPQDLEFFQQHFPESWQIALVLKPDTFLPTKAGFFFREEDGRIRADSSYQEFSLPARNSPVAAQKTDRDRSIEPVEAPKPTLSIPVVPLAAPQASAGARNPLWIAALTVAVVVIILVWLTIPRTVESTPEPLALTLQENDGQLRISWNRTATPILEHPNGVIEIREGDETAVVELNRDQLQSGTVIYKRNSRNVGVSMKLGKTEETAIFIGPPPDAGRLERTRQAADLAPVAQLPAGTERDANAGKSAPEKAKERDTPKKAPPRTFLSRALTPKRREPVPVSLQMAPQIERGSSSALSPPFLGNLPVIPAPPSSPAPPSAAASMKTGALIWTGRLSKNDALSIEGNRASTGVLTGAIPGQPVRIHAYPAELTGDGINVYSSDHPPGRTDPPAVRNGWNKTSYRSNPRVAGALKVVEAPGPKNGWNRLVLRSDNVRLSIILIEWELLSSSAQ